MQADILKEDQAQNTCIFSTEFALQADGRRPGVVRRATRCGTSTRSRSPAITSPKPGRTRSRSSPSRSPTASPTASATCARGMAIDDFAPNFSFFFSNGLDAEYAVIGRVARRIWAIAMRERYGASERSQKLKYHVQTSGRSLHAQEMAFNDIRTTLQALTAIQDHCNSLHTNAYDEAVTTPTEESVRRALAIQLDHQARARPRAEREPAAGRLRDRASSPIAVEEAVLQRVRAALRARRRARRDGDALPARSKIQDESLLLRDAEALGRAADRRRQHVREPEPRATPRRPRALMRSSDDGEARAAREPARLPGASRRRAARRARAAAAGRAARRATSSRS